MISVAQMAETLERDFISEYLGTIDKISRETNEIEKMVEIVSHDINAKTPKIKLSETVLALPKIKSIDSTASREKMDFHKIKDTGDLSLENTILQFGEEYFKQSYMYCLLIQNHPESTKINNDDFITYLLDIITNIEIDVFDRLYYLYLLINENKSEIEQYYKSTRDDKDLSENKKIGIYCLNLLYYIKLILDLNDIDTMKKKIQIILIANYIYINEYTPDEYNIDEYNKLVKKEILNFFTNSIDFNLVDGKLDILYYKIIFVLFPHPEQEMYENRNYKTIMNNIINYKFNKNDKIDKINIYLFTVDSLLNKGIDDILDIFRIGRVFKKLGAYFSPEKIELYIKRICTELNININDIILVDENHKIILKDDGKSIINKIITLCKNLLEFYNNNKEFEEWIPELKLFIKYLTTAWNYKTPKDESHVETRVKLLFADDFAGNLLPTQITDSYKLITENINKQELWNKLQALVDIDQTEKYINYINYSLFAKYLQDIPLEDAVNTLWIYLSTISEVEFSRKYDEEIKTFETDIVQLLKTKSITHQEKIDKLDGICDQYIDICSMNGTVIYSSYYYDMVNLLFKTHIGFDVHSDITLDTYKDHLNDPVEHLGMSDFIKEIKQQIITTNIDTTKLYEKIDTQQIFSYQFITEKLDYYISGYNSSSSIKDKKYYYVSVILFSIIRYLSKYFYKPGVHGENGKYFDGTEYKNFEKIGDSINSGDLFMDDVEGVANTINTLEHHLFYNIISSDPTKQIKAILSKRYEHVMYEYVKYLYNDKIKLLPYHVNVWDNEKIAKKYIDIGQIGRYNKWQKILRIIKLLYLFNISGDNINELKVNILIFIKSKFLDWSHDRTMLVLPTLINNYVDNILTSENLHNTTLVNNLISILNNYIRLITEFNPEHLREIENLLMIRRPNGIYRLNFMDYLNNKLDIPVSERSLTDVATGATGAPVQEQEQLIKVTIRTKKSVVADPEPEIITTLNISNNKDLIDKCIKDERVQGYLGSDNPIYRVHFTLTDNHSSLIEYNTDRSIDTDVGIYKFAKNYYVTKIKKLIDTMSKQINFSDGNIISTGVKKYLKNYVENYNGEKNIPEELIQKINEIIMISKNALAGNSVTIHDFNTKLKVFEDYYYFYTSVHKLQSYYATDSNADKNKAVASIIKYLITLNKDKYTDLEGLIVFPKYEEIFMNTFKEIVQDQQIIYVTEEEKINKIGDILLNIINPIRADGSFVPIPIRANSSSVPVSTTDAISWTDDLLGKLKQILESKKDNCANATITDNYTGETVKFCVIKGPSSFLSIVRTIYGDDVAIAKNGKPIDGTHLLADFTAGTTYEIITIIKNGDNIIELKRDTRELFEETKYIHSRLIKNYEEKKKQSYTKEEFEQLEAEAKATVPSTAAEAVVAEASASASASSTVAAPSTAPLTVAVAEAASVKAASASTTSVKAVSAAVASVAPVVVTPAPAAPAEPAPAAPASTAPAAPRLQKEVTIKDTNSISKATLTASNNKELIDKCIKNPGVVQFLGIANPIYAVHFGLIMNGTLINYDDTLIVNTDCTILKKTTRQYFNNMKKLIDTIPDGKTLKFDDLNENSTDNIKRSLYMYISQYNKQNNISEDVLQKINNIINIIKKYLDNGQLINIIGFRQNASQILKYYNFCYGIDTLLGETGYDNRHIGYMIDFLITINNEYDVLGGFNIGSFKQEFLIKFKKLMGSEKYIHVTDTEKINQIGAILLEIYNMQRTGDAAPIHADGSTHTSVGTSLSAFASELTSTKNPNLFLNELKESIEAADKSNCTNIKIFDFYLGNTINICVEKTDESFVTIISQIYGEHVNVRNNSTRIDINVKLNELENNMLYYIYSIITIDDKPIMVSKYDSTNSIEQLKERFLQDYTDDKIQNIINNLIKNYESYNTTEYTRHEFQTLVDSLNVAEGGNSIHKYRHVQKKYKAKRLKLVEQLLKKANVI